VAGTSGTKLTGEMFGEMLSADHIVRKQLEKPFWDFSIPLTILGIEDRKYNAWEWLGVILECLKVLIFGRSIPGWVVLQMNTLKKDIINYWLDIVSPDVSILTNFNGKLLSFERKIAERTKKIVLIYPCDNSSLQNIDAKLYLVGESKSCNIQVKDFNQNKHGTTFWIQIGKEKQKFIAAQTGFFMKGPIVASSSALISMGKNMSDVSERLKKVEINVDRFIDLY
jgi:UDP-N-acetylmuramyl pentapeptide synthase